MKSVFICTIVILLVCIQLSYAQDQPIKMEPLIPAQPMAFGVKIEMTLIMDINATLSLDFCKSDNGSLISNPATELNYKDVGHWEADTGDLQSWASGQCAFSSSEGPFTFFWNYQVNQKPHIFAATVPEKFQVTKVNHGSPLSNLECFILCNLNARDCFSEKCFTVNE